MSDGMIWNIFSRNSFKPKLNAIRFIQHIRSSSNLSGKEILPIQTTDLQCYSTGTVKQTITSRMLNACTINYTRNTIKLIHSRKSLLLRSPCTTLIYPFRKAIANLCVSDVENDRRYTALCRNIRAYSVQVFQNFSIRTKRIPTKDIFKRICEERDMKLALNSPQEFQRLERKNSQAIHFFRGEDSMDGDTNAVVLVDLR